MKKVDPLSYYDQDVNYWLRPESNLIRLGITDFSQAFFGEVNSIVDLPDIGQVLHMDAIFALVESDKSTTELLLPLSGKVIAINDDLTLHPQWINEDCYHKGWILLLEVSDFKTDDFLDAQGYLDAIHPFFNKTS